jgi:WD40 repeat protein
MNQPRNGTRSPVAIATRLVLLTFFMLLAVAFLAIVEVIVLWQVGITYTPKSSVVAMGVMDFSLVSHGRWGVSRVYFRRAQLMHACDWEVLLHDMQHPDSVRRLNTSCFDPMIMSAAPQGNQLAIANSVGVIRIWDELQASNRSRVLMDNKYESISAMDHSPDGKWLFAAGEEWIYGWRSGTGELIYKLKHEDGRCSLDFSRDSTKLMFIGWNSCLRLFDIERGEMLLDKKLNAPPIFAAALSPEGGKVALVGLRGIVMVVDLAQGIELWRTNIGAESPIAFSDDGRQVAIAHEVSSTEFELQVRESATGKIRQQFLAHPGRVRGLAFTTNGTLISWDLEGNIRRWNPETQTKTWSFSAREWIARDPSFGWSFARLSSIRRSPTSTSQAPLVARRPVSENQPAVPTRSF